MQLFIEEILENTIVDLWRELTGQDVRDLRPHRQHPRFCSLFEGRCGYAQCFLAEALKAQGIQAHPMATQSLDQYWWGHAALTVQTIDRGEPRWFVVDPTFMQFYLHSAAPEKPRPAFLLSQSPEGAAILDELLAKGYFELTPRRARLYLASFCLGNLSLTDDAALSFLKDPPHHHYHLSCTAEGGRPDRIKSKSTIPPAISRKPGLG